MMNRDEEILLGLRSAGVPLKVCATTLVKEEALDLRVLVEGKALIRDEDASGIYMHPRLKTTELFGRARKLFYLVAKELFLSGHTVYCIPMFKLMETLKGDGSEDAESRIERVRMVFVLDFYEDGAPCPYSPQDASRLRAWTRQRFEDGKAVSFLSDSNADGCTSWWPLSFTGFIKDSFITYPV
jgi:hypothetical protein